MLAVNRRYGRADYLPCIAWGSIAQKCSQLEVGTLLRLGGRLQSRTYTKVTEDGPVQRTAYEVSIMTLVVGE
ncbi:MAG: single-stranded DNA-binding protein [Clostridiales bacterium]|nr:single-stranded DNA-binding protein [Clostridiales bacterium]